KFYEVVKYGATTNHIWSGVTMIINAAAWERLPKPLRDTVEHRFDEAAMLERKDQQKSDASAVTELQQKGMLHTKADFASFRTVVRKAGLYAQWRSSFGSEA